MILGRGATFMVNFNGFLYFFAFYFFAVKNACGYFFIE